ncbi:hypothetical protein HYFRA_00005460 [Hymenoscyphus fraxineus]|uniref:Vacuolar protein sorting-associated protein 62 n=1 Tax=Hymenoscyphus fraxineus TaxID=746836 RepID=A0A9N9KT65_9HELO|nr:hypothetical protein HYFRA_00005460 [Hymenoscyphus fraxineus]
MGKMAEVWQKEQQVRGKDVSYLDGMDGNQKYERCLHELEKGLLVRGEDPRDGVVNSNTNAGLPRLGWDWYYKLMYAAGLLLLCWWYGLSMGSQMIAEERTEVEGVPQYVLDYAPLVYLDTGEAYFPSDIDSQIDNTHPEINYTAIAEAPSLTPDNLSLLNNFGDSGKYVYLTSNVDVTTNPAWLEGVVPDADGETVCATSAAIIVVDKGNGLVDAFYMYFYAFNKGTTVLGQELGDHIGDWEHNMIRFLNGVPQAVWYSQHSNGQAFTYEAVEKIGIRPVSYSANGTHANFATIGSHDHTIPGINLPTGLLVDTTSKGMLWDPSLSAYFYKYTITSSNTGTSASTGIFEGLLGAPVSIMEFNGRWGDKQFAEGDPRQPEAFFGFWKFVDGPTGPADKYLVREEVCPGNGVPCVVRNILVP